MKKLSLLLLGSLVFSQAVQAAPGPFRGFYGGANLIWSHRFAKTTLPAADIRTVLGSRYQQNAVDKKLKTQGLTYGFYAGYGQTCNGWYWGGELNLEHPTASERGKYDVDSTMTRAGVAPNRGGGELKVEYKRGMVFGLAPRIGVVVAENNLVYVKLGIEYSRDKVEVKSRCYNHLFVAPMMAGMDEVVSHEEISKSKNQFVFVPSVGYERAFGKVLARIEYGYTMGARIRTPDLFKDRNTARHSYAANSGVSMRYAEHRIKVGLAYQF